MSEHLLLTILSVLVWAAFGVYCFAIFLAVVGRAAQALAEAIENRRAGR